MNTEQIMSLHNKAALTYNKDGLLYAARSEQLQAAIEALVQERDALKAELGDLPASQAEMLREIKVLRKVAEKALTTVELVCSVGLNESTRSSKKRAASAKD